MSGPPNPRREISQRPEGWARGYWISVAPALMAAMLTACGSDAGDASVPELGSGRTTTAIYAGTQDNDASQNSAVVAVKVGNASPFELCTGTLIAPNVVLTAHHCVSTPLTTTISCDENGASGNGAQLGADVDLATVHVFLGASPALVNGTPAAGAKAIFHAQTDNVCNTDVALIVLDRSVPNVTPLRVRLSSGVVAGESVRAVGYGQNDQQLPIGTRLRKDGVGVLNVGKLVTTNQVPLASNEFELGLSICQGDSGGPAISETTGAIVGVVSRGGACTDLFGHVYASLAPMKSVFDQAFAVAGGAPIDENAPAPPPTPSPTPTPTGTGTSPAPPGGNGGQPGAPHGGTNLHSGAGNNCSASGAPSPEASTLGGMAIGIVIALALFIVRRKRVE